MDVKQWVGEGKEITLPSGRKARVLDIEALTLIVNEDGSIPNIVASFLDDDTGNEEKEINTLELVKALPLLNRVTRAMLAWPKIVDSQAEYENGEGVLLHHVPLIDKFSLVAYGIGGEQAMNAVRGFSGQQASGLGVIPAEPGLQPTPKPSDGNK